MLGEATEALTDEEEEDLAMFHKAMKKKAKRLASACASTIHLYNMVTA